MNANSQNNLDRLRDLIERGELTADQANVEMVRMERVRIVKGRMPAQVRKALNEAVKSGHLAHMKKDGYKPECYYHPTFEYLARGERAREEDATRHALMKVAGFR